VFIVSDPSLISHWTRKPNFIPFYFGESILIGLVWAFLNRVAQAIAIGWGVIEDPQRLSLSWLYPLRDLSASSSGARVSWVARLSGETNAIGWLATARWRESYDAEMNAIFHP
jgi:hypothetical protein